MARRRPVRIQPPFQLVQLFGDIDGDPHQAVPFARISVIDTDLFAFVNQGLPSPEIPGGAYHRPRDAASPE